MGHLYGIPMGILLMGTDEQNNIRIAESVIAKAAMNYIIIEADELDNNQQDASAILENVINQAIEMQPTIIVINRIDEILQEETTKHNENIKAQMLNLFSQPELYRGRIIILGVTKHPEKIDTAFKRAGRFDKRVPLIPFKRNENQNIEAEDNILINTSDVAFIPKRNSQHSIKAAEEYNYFERFEQLLSQKCKAKTVTA